ncbi:DUF6069 family protein [Prauserella flavalba]|uniref:DUF6069 family protein n=1 Tax=Prauserella flavalba TaxID=1477506 RepID=UPI001FE43873|nr:DUF6069 family protein [Prauserella flavalba]
MNRQVKAGTLWAGGAASACVAALVAVVGILVARSLVGVAVLAPEGEGAWGGADTVTYALGSAAVAVLATALLHVLLLTTPRARLFFGWIGALVTAIGIVVPLSLSVDLGARLATALINLAIGFSIVVTLLGVARVVALSGEARPHDTWPGQPYSL